MDAVTEKARAKLNFCLDVGKRRGEKHLLDTLIVPVGLFDTVVLQKRADKKVVVRYDGVENKYATDPAKNLAEKIVEKYALPGVDVSVEKRIPERAGLGGSSTDAAAVARGLERLFGLGKIDPSFLTETGSDVYAAYLDAPCRVRGTGELVEIVDGIKIPDVLLVTFDEGVSTAECYKLFDQVGGEKGNVDEAISAMRNGREFSPKNALLNAARTLCPIIGRGLEELAKHDLPHGMTGSGSAIFSFGYDREDFLKKTSRLGDVGRKTILFRE